MGLCKMSFSTFCLALDRIGDKADKRLNVSPQLVVDSVVAGFPESLFIIYFGIIAFFRVINRNRRMN